MKTSLELACLFLAIEMTVALAAEVFGARLPIAFDPSHGFLAFLSAFLVLFVWSDYAAPSRRHPAPHVRAMPLPTEKSPHALAA